MRVAIVHHWFVTRGGGERVAECLASLFPQAEIFTLLADPAGLPESLTTRTLHTSFLQKIPFARTHHRHAMPLYPAAVESLDLRGFDLVLSSDSGPVKGVRLSPGAVHICYCHSPMRYLHDSYDAYRATMSPLTRALFTLTAPRVRRFDTAAAARVTYFLANSHYVADRIRRAYHRDATVIHPPIDLTLARTVPHPGPHYLCAGRLVPYKRTELLIEACNQLGRPLRIAGTGPEEARLRRLAGPTVTFLGALSNEALWQQYAECRALLFAADEDFGMVPLEAQACGRPVICFGSGGSLETVRGPSPETETPALDRPPHTAASPLIPPTGVYFAHQTVASAIEGIQRFERDEATFSPANQQAWAATFATPVFLHAIRTFVLTHVPAAADSIADAIAPQP